MDLPPETKDFGDITAVFKSASKDWKRSGDSAGNFEARHGCTCSISITEFLRIPVLGCGVVGIDIVRVRGLRWRLWLKRSGQYDELDLWLPIEFSQLGHLECTDNKSQLDSSLHKVENLYSCNAKSLRPPVFRGYCLRLNCRHCTQTFHNVLHVLGNSKWENSHLISSLHVDDAFGTALEVARKSSCDLSIINILTKSGRVYLRKDSFHTTAQINIAAIDVPPSPLIQCVLEKSASDIPLQLHTFQRRHILCGQLWSRKINNAWCCSERNTRA